MTDDAAPAATDVHRHCLVGYRDSARGQPLRKSPVHANSLNIQTIFIGIAVATFDWTTGSSRISNHLSSYERSSPIAAEPLTALAADDFDTHVQRLTLEL